MWSEDDPIIKIYRRLAKKRYLRGKHTYEHERIYVPIPSRLHDIVRPFLNQHLKISITRQPMVKRHYNNHHMDGYINGVTAGLSCYKQNQQGMFANSERLNTLANT